MLYHFIFSGQCKQYHTLCGTQICSSEAPSVGVDTSSCNHALPAVRGFFNSQPVVVIISKGYQLVEITTYTKFNSLYCYPIYTSNLLSDEPES
jgi:hypothetical protein